MADILPFLISGIVFGTAAGITPGPLLTLVISETLRHNKKEGIKIAAAPLLTDLPIIALTLLLLGRLSNINYLFGIISFAGAVFIAHLGYRCIKTEGINITKETAAPGSLKKGIIVNLLSPYPYIFWLTIGAPVTIKAWNSAFLSAPLFLFSFYFCMAASKITIALLADRSRKFLHGKTYIYTIRFLGGTLIFFSLIFVRNGLGYFNIFGI